MAHWRLHYHLVWATVLRQPLISTDAASIIEQALYRKARELGVTIHQVGGMEDHLHVVASIRRGSPWPVASSSSRAPARTRSTATCTTNLASAGRTGTAH
jgi:REP element-mobilizing transposase RayT